MGRIGLLVVLLALSLSAGCATWCRNLDDWAIERCCNQGKSPRSGKNKSVDVRDECGRCVTWRNDQEGGIGGPDGPDIVIDPNGWSIDNNGGNVNITPDIGYTIVTNNVDSPCELRDDFIGLGIRDFRYQRVGSEIERQGKELTLENSTTQKKLLIKRTSLGTIQWTFTDSANGKSCVLAPSGDIPPPSASGQVPIEFLELTSHSDTTFTDRTGNDVEYMLLRVRVP